VLVECTSWSRIMCRLSCCRRGVGARVCGRNLAASRLGAAGSTHTTHPWLAVAAQLSKLLQVVQTTDAHTDAHTAVHTGRRKQERAGVCTGC